MFGNAVWSQCSLVSPTFQSIYSKTSAIYRSKAIELFPKGTHLKIGDEFRHSAQERKVASSFHLGHFSVRVCLRHTVVVLCINLIQITNLNPKEKRNKSPIFANISLRLRNSDTSDIQSLAYSTDSTYNGLPTVASCCLGQFALFTDSAYALV